MASVVLTSPPVVSLYEDGSIDSMRSSVDICLQLLVEDIIDRNVNMFLKIDDITTGQYNDIIINLHTIHNSACVV